MQLARIVLYCNWKHLALARLVFPFWRGKNHMALKKIGTHGRIASGRWGYFVKYCPSCKEHVYLEEGFELEEFLAEMYVPRFFFLLKTYIKRRLPKISFSYQNQESALAFSEATQQQAVERADRFCRSFFNAKYQEKGGVEKLESMILEKIKPSEIARHFGITRQRASVILHSYERGLVQ